MLLIPVMELKSGRSVYTQHKSDGDKLISEDPVEAAERWVEAGAKRIHVVDVDSVQARQPINAHKIAAIHRRFPELEFQISGICREDDLLIWLDAGAKYLIMNSKAICTPGFISEMCVEYAGSIMVAIDSHNGKVRFRGREKEHDLLTLATRFDDQGVQGILLTDIPDSGHVNGCNIQTASELAAKVEIPIFANGGVKTMADLEAIREPDLAGIVLGRPLHDQQFDFKTAQACIDKL